MVIGERFAWAHLPKTGGDTTAELFRLFPDVVQFADPNEDKHVSFASREREIEGRVLVANIRRLPAWTLSWAQWRVRTPHADGSFPPFDSPQQMVTTPRADALLADLTGGGRFAVDRWLRAERLAEDFLDFLSDFREVSDEDRSRVSALQRRNTHVYDRKVRHWFTPEQLETLYDTNPRWAAIEERVYGDLRFLGRART